MDLFILILLLFLLFVIVLPISAMTKAGSAFSAVERLRARIGDLEKRLQELRGAKSETRVLRQQVETLATRLQKLDGGPPLEGGFALEPTIVPGRERLPAAEDDASAGSPKLSEVPASAKPQQVAREIVGEQPDGQAAKVKADAGAIEMKLGTYWFVRIGVVLLLTGAGILAYYNKQFFFDLSPLTKVCGLYLLSAVMGGVGYWLQHAREKYKNYGQVLVAGGFAGIYFTTYAAHILPPVQVILNPTVALLMLLAWGGFMVWIADRLRSETVALFALGASYYATYVPLIHSGGVSHSVILASNLILAVAAVVFMLRNRWLKVPMVSMGAAYVGFLVWRLRVLENPSLTIVLLFACSLWAVYTAAVFLSRHEAFVDVKRATFLTVNNAALFGLLSWDVLRDYETQFWILPITFGAVLIGCALATVRLLRDQPLSRNSYLTQGLVLVALGLMATQLSDSIKGPIFAAESVVLLFMAIRRNNAMLQVAAFVAAGISVVYGLVAIEMKAGDYLLSCLSIGTFLLFGAWLCHHRLDAGNKSPLRPRVTLFTISGLMLGLGAFVVRYYGKAPVHDWMPAILFATTALFCGSAYLLRMREFVLLGQAPALLGLLFSIGFASASPGFSWPLALGLLGALGLSHWWRWQRERLLACCPDREPFQRTPLALEAIFSAGVVLLLLVWIHAGVAIGTPWLVLGSSLAVGLAVYGFTTRAPFIAAFGQVFLAAACAVLIQVCLGATGGDALRALVPIATLLITNLVLPAGAARIGRVTDFARDGIGKARSVYRISAGGLGLLWIYRFVPGDYHLLVTVLVGALFLLAPCWRPAREWHWLSAAYAIVGSLYLVSEFVLEQATLPSFVAIIGLLAVQQLARRRAGQFGIPDPAHDALILGGGIALFFWTTYKVPAWMPLGETHGLRSITWAALAVIYFTLGLKLKERWYRLMGLGTLGIALLSLVPIIWQMSTELKIASFFVLGLVFVGLGFVYNRNKEQIKKLL